jgi:hypothetical protein
VTAFTRTYVRTHGDDGDGDDDDGDDADKNELTTLPDELANLSKLQIINVSFNQLTVFDNVTFRNFSELEEIHATNNQLDHLPRGLGQCKKLRVIDLSHNLLKSIVCCTCHHLATHTRTTAHTTARVSL